MENTLVSNIELLLRSRLIKEALSSVLTAAGFTVFHEPIQGDTQTVAVIDFEDCKDPESISAHQVRGAKIVALISEANSREAGFDEIEPLSGILTYDLSGAAVVGSLRLVCSGERVFPRDTPSYGTETASPTIGHAASIRWRPSLGLASEKWRVPFEQ
jgi:hypothetical protein